MTEKYINEALALLIVVPTIALEFMGTPVSEWLMALTAMITAFYLKK